MSPDLTQPLRAAIVAYAAVTSQLEAYKGSFPVFTKRPVPTDAPYPCIVISQDISNGNEDGINDFRPVVVRDIAVYGLNSQPGDVRVVEEISYSLRELFHRQKGSLTVAGWSVIDVVVSGPSDAPAEDLITGRRVELTVRLAAQA